MGPTRPALADVTPDQQRPAIVALEPPARIERMVRDHHGLVWRALRRFGLTADEADDAAQRVFLVAARKLSSIAEGAERAFLFGTAVRVASNVRRVRHETAELDAEAVVEAVASPEQLLDQHQARALLDSLLDTLPLELRSVLVLSEIEQFPKTEVGQMLGIAPGTVASRLRRARRLLEQRAARALARARWRGGDP
jgi:RNA polymerase sigma-70 factor, ECF subfamily